MQAQNGGAFPAPAVPTKANSIITAGGTYTYGKRTLTNHALITGITITKRIVELWRHQKELKAQAKERKRR